jgi:hypothetical protein
VLQPRNLVPSTLDRAVQPEISAKACLRCQALREHYAPKPGDVPEALRGLTAEEAKALSPLEVDVGPEVRAKNRGGFATGYRQHVSMVKFSWAAESVADRIRGLPDRDMRARAKAAHKWLLTRAADSAYREFHEEHLEFLESNPDSDDKARRRWLNFIERLGLECAAWPHLFWETSMCFSWERATDARRIARRQKGPSLEQVLRAEVDQVDQEAGAEEDEGCMAAEDDDDKDEEDGMNATDNDTDDGARHSTKRTFAALALSPLLDHAASYEARWAKRAGGSNSDLLSLFDGVVALSPGTNGLFKCTPTCRVRMCHRAHACDQVLHYAYDLNMWSALGAKKNLGLDMPMRVLAKRLPFSPMYWRGVHLGLLDLVRQVGYPKIFWTLAPDEWTFPYHEFVRRDMAKLLRQRLHLPVQETLHLAHVLTQTVRGLLTGLNQRHATQRGSRYWGRHILAAKDDAGCEVKLAYFLRLEFQDGTRKEPSQDYHGSGRPHLHVLIFTDNPQALNLHESASASATEHADEAFRNYVLGSQLDRDARTPWPVQEGGSAWDRITDALRLYHSAEDHAAGTRAFFLDIMDVLKCHQDFQMCNDDGLLRAYVAKYVSKFSDSMLEDYLTDVGHGDTVAMNVLFRYKPMEPEMILHAFGAKFRQWEAPRVRAASGGASPSLRSQTVRVVWGCTWRSLYSGLGYGRCDQAQGSMKNRVKSKLCSWSLARLMRRERKFLP